MKYVLGDLLRVREFREKLARQEVLKKSVCLYQAMAEVERRNLELSRYHAWRVEKEDLLFKEVEKKIITLKQLEDLRITTSLLRENELALEQAVRDAEKARQTATQELEEARRSYEAALKNTRKIEEHKSGWLEEMLRESERSADKEMEEFHYNPDLLDSEDDDEAQAH